MRISDWSSDVCSSDLSEAAVYRRRCEALDIFLDDFAAMGGARYVPLGLPYLPVADSAFDLALVSHFLFLYGDDLDSDFHIAALRELLRVAREEIGRASGRERVCQYG